MNVKFKSMTLLYKASSFFESYWVRLASKFLNKVNKIKLIVFGSVNVPKIAELDTDLNFYSLEKVVSGPRKFQANNV